MTEKNTDNLYEYEYEIGVWEGMCYMYPGLRIESYRTHFFYKNYTFLENRHFEPKWFLDDS